MRKVRTVKLLRITVIMFNGDIILLYIAVQQEKTQQNLLHGVESFDKAALKPTDTVEKIILPAPEGDY